MRIIDVFYPTVVKAATIVNSTHLTVWKGIYLLERIFWREQDATVINPARKFRVVGSPNGKVPAMDTEGIIND